MKKLITQLVLIMCILGCQPVYGSLARFMRHTHACAAYYTGALQTAQHDFEQLVVDDPSNSTFLRGLADCLYAQGKFEPALSYYQHVLANSADQCEKEQLYFNSGCAQAQLQNFKEALGSFEAVVVLNKNNKRAQHNIEILKKLLEQKPQQQKDDNSSKKNKTKQNEDDNHEQQDKTKNQDKRDQKQKPESANNDACDRKHDQEHGKQRQPQHTDSSQPTKPSGQKQLSKPLARLLNDIDRLDQQGQHLYLQALAGQRNQEKQERRAHDW